MAVKHNLHLAVESFVSGHNTAQDNVECQSVHLNFQLQQAIQPAVPGSNEDNETFLTTCKTIIEFKFGKCCAWSGMVCAGENKYA